MKFGHVFHQNVIFLIFETRMKFTSVFLDQISTVSKRVTCIKNKSLAYRVGQDNTFRRRRETRLYIYTWFLADTVARQMFHRFRPGQTHNRLNMENKKDVISRHWYRFPNGYLRNNQIHMYFYKINGAAYGIQRLLPVITDVTYHFFDRATDKSIGV